MITQFKIKVLLIALAVVCCSAVLAPALAQRAVLATAKTQYQVSTLPDFGGTSSGGNSVNDQAFRLQANA